MRRYPIDPSRVTITGMSMGGIGSAAVPLHRPHVFAAAEPLCGYHSYLIRGDVAGRAQRPWERYLAEERSNALWAENGEHLPLFIVHGTQDLPEENSGVLIERYEKLHFAVKHEHPEAGHNVWQQTYEDLKGLTWLMNRRVDLHPSHVRFKTTRTRWSTSAWVAVDELAGEAAWGEVDARANAKTRTVTATTSGVAQVTFARDPQLIGTAPVTVTIDGQRFAFDEGEALVLGRDPAVGRAGSWRKGALAHAGLYKHGAVTGPIRDVFAEPILFVYGDGERGARERAGRARVREDQARRPGLLSSDERHRVLREEASRSPTTARSSSSGATTASSPRSSATSAVPDPRRGGRRHDRSRANHRQGARRGVRSSEPAAPGPLRRRRRRRRRARHAARDVPARSPPGLRGLGRGVSRPREGRCSSAPARSVQAGSSRRSGRCQAQLADPLARASRAAAEARAPIQPPQGESAPVRAPIRQSLRNRGSRDRFVALHWCHR